MEPNVRATSAAIKSLLRHGDDALTSEDWDGALEYYGRALDANANEPGLYLRLFLANRHLLSVDELCQVATQIVAETPAERTSLAEVLAMEIADGRSVDPEVVGLLGLEVSGGAGSPSHDDEAKLGQTSKGDAEQGDPSGVDEAEKASDDAPEPAREISVVIPSDQSVALPRCSYPQRIRNLKLSRQAFDRTFEDEYWQAAYAHGDLELRRHMERAHADAEAVFDAAFAEERTLLQEMCNRAKVRIPRMRHITTAALASCNEALSSFAETSGGRKQEVSSEYAYLGNNLRTAHACLWVGVALIVVGAVLLGLAIIPRGMSVTNNAFAAFPEYFVPLGIVVVLVGVVLLVLRSLLVRSNREAMSERQASAGVAKSNIAQDYDLLNTKVAAVRSRCHSLESLPLDTSNDEFEKACADLDATVKALGK